MAMSNLKTTSYKRYIDNLNDLRAFVNDSQKIQIGQKEDSGAEQFTVEHANFLTKSALVQLCVCLESYLKDLFLELYDEYQRRVDLVKIPKNVILIASKDPTSKITKVAADNISKDLRKNTDPTQFFKLKENKKGIDDFISGNPYRTKVAFSYMGIDLDKVSSYIQHKDLIQSIVSKRNKVLHYNDQASDLTFPDIIQISTVFEEYVEDIDAAIQTAIAS